MPRDLKIGMALGLVLVIAAGLWLATRPNLSTAMLQRRGADFQGGDHEQEDADPNSEDRDLRGRSADVSVRPNQTVTESEAEREALPYDSTVYEQAEKIATERFHIVRKAETLSDISRRYYGSASKWQKIVAANRKTIRDPDKLTAGTKLIIPD
jgi:nucleoid-associated protein YgaU